MEILPHVLGFIIKCNTLWNVFENVKADCFLLKIMHVNCIMFDVIYNFYNIRRMGSNPNIMEKNGLLI